MGSLTISAGFAVMFGMFFLITQYFQFVQGHSPLQAGVRNLPFALTMVAVSPRSPKLAERLGKRGAITVGLVIQVLGFVVLALHDTDTPYLITAIALVLLATGMALLMPPASEAIISSLPPSKAGVGSAWNDSTREIGGALGIAVLGSLLSSGYRSSIEPATAQLPDEAAEAVGESIGAAFRVAQSAGLPELIEPAKNAFVDGMTTAFWAAAVWGVLVAVVVAWKYPAKGDEPAQVTNADFAAI